MTAAGSGVRVILGGTLQSRISYAWWDTEPGRVGAGIRRARLRALATLRKEVGAYLQIDGNNATVETVDAYVFYRATRRLTFRLGRMVSAVPRSAERTSHTRIDAVDRAVIAEYWGRHTVGSGGRDFGIDLHYETELGQAILFLHNGDGSWDRLRGNFRESILTEDPTRGIERDLRDVAISFYSALYPPAVTDLEVGGYVGYNGSRNPNTAFDDGLGRDYLSYSAHLYWGG